MMRQALAPLVALLGFVQVASAAGVFTPGLPEAGDYPNTWPLTGQERLPADTALPEGLTPQSEAITTEQLRQYLFEYDLFSRLNTWTPGSTAVLDPTGVADNSAAFSSIFSALAGNGGTGRIAAGTYKLNSLVIPAGGNYDIQFDPGANFVDGGGATYTGTIWKAVGNGTTATVSFKDIFTATVGGNVTISGEPTGLNGTFPVIASSYGWVTFYSAYNGTSYSTGTAVIPIPAQITYTTAPAYNNILPYNWTSGLIPYQWPTFFSQKMNSQVITAGWQDKYHGFNVDTIYVKNAGSATAIVAHSPQAEAACGIPTATSFTRAVTGASGDGSHATVTFAGTDVAKVGDRLNVLNVNPDAYNGFFAVTAASAGSVTYASSATAAYVSGGTVQNGTGVCAVWAQNPVAQVTADGANVWVNESDSVDLSPHGANALYNVSARSAGHHPTTAALQVGAYNPEAGFRWGLLFTGAGSSSPSMNIINNPGSGRIVYLSGALSTYRGIDIEQGLFTNSELALPSLFVGPTPTTTATVTGATTSGSSVVVTFAGTDESPVNTAVVVVSSGGVSTQSYVTDSSPGSISFYGSSTDVSTITYVSTASKVKITAGTSAQDATIALVAPTGLSTASANLVIKPLGAGNLSLTPAGGALILGPNGAGNVSLQRMATQMLGLTSSGIILGPNDSASPVAEALRMNSVAAGNTDTSSSATFYLVGSKGTGTGNGGNVAIQVAKPGTTGSTQNTPTNALVVSGSTGAISLPLVSTGTPAASLCLDSSGNIIKKTTAGACI